MQEPETEMPGRTELHGQTVGMLAFEQLVGADLIAVLARPLLAVLGCLTPGEPVPHDLLTACLGDSPDPDAATDARLRLQNLGLLEARDPTTSTFHRLLHGMLHAQHVDHEPIQPTWKRPLWTHWTE